MSTAKASGSSVEASRYRRESFWLDSLEESLEPLASLEGEIKCDVVIVGAGFTGLWTAYHLKLQAPDLDVVILEAEIAGFGASGRNGGWFAGWMDGFESWVQDPKTRDAALLLQRGLIESVERLGSILRAEDIDCHYARDGMVWVATTPQQERRVRATARFLESLGFGEPHFAVLSGAETRERAAVQGCRMSMFARDFAAIQPARLARGLARAVRRRGVRIFERSPVRSIEEGVARTSRGAVRAGTVVLAAEAYTHRLPGFSRWIAPVHSRMIVTAPLGNSLRERTGLSNRVGVSILSNMPFFAQRTADDRIAIGSRDDYYFGSRIHTDFRRDDPLTQFVHRGLLRTFPALEGVPITHSWGGPIGLTRKLRPFVYLDRKKAFAWLGGYSGSGLSTSHLAAHTLADLYLGEASERTRYPWVVDSLPRRWEPEPIRWLGITTANTWRYVKDRFEA